MKKLLLSALTILISGFVIVSNIQADESKGAESGITPVILINPFIVPAEKIDEAVAMWEQARNFLKKEKGYISTELHQSLSPDAAYPLINVAKWESMKTYKAATKKMRAQANLPRIEGVRPAPQLYTVIRN